VPTTTISTAATATDGVSNGAAAADDDDAADVNSGVSDVNGDTAMDVDEQPAAAAATASSTSNSSSCISSTSSSCPFAVVRSAVYAAPFGPPLVPLNRKQRRMLAGISGVQQGGSADTAIALTAAASTTAATDTALTGAQRERQHREHVLAVAPPPQLAMPTLLPVRILMTKVRSVMQLCNALLFQYHQYRVCGTAKLYQLCSTFF
jgi:hypothetical protein